MLILSSENLKELHSIEAFASVYVHSFWCADAAQFITCSGRAALFVYAISASARFGLCVQVLGKGSFGKVFLVRLIPTGELYAMKVLKKADVKRRRQVEHTRAERRIMGDIDFPFIVALRFAFQVQGLDLHLCLRM